MNNYEEVYNVIIYMKLYNYMELSNLRPLSNVQHPTFVQPLLTKQKFG